MSVRPWLPAALAAAVAAAACSDRGSDLAVIYRGDASAYRTLVHVRLDTGARARDVTPSFPSGAHPDPVPTEGVLPVTVSFLIAPGDTAARLAVPPLRLAPRTSYRVDVVVAARRPESSRCTGPWAATAIAPRHGSAASGADSLYVSVAQTDRRGEQPHCEDA